MQDSTVSSVHGALLILKSHFFRTLHDEKDAIEGKRLFNARDTNSHFKFGCPFSRIQFSLTVDFRVLFYSLYSIKCFTSILRITIPINYDTILQGRCHKEQNTMSTLRPF